MDTANPDYVDLLAGDLDVWIRPTPDNASHAYLALADFGAPLADVNEKDLRAPGVVSQIGIAPIRVDVTLL